MIARLRNAWRKLSGKSPREAFRHAVLRVAERVNVQALEFPLLPGDIADSHAPQAHRRVWAAGSDAARPRVGWLVVPPGSGSGGHTTLFRMMEACRDAGCSNALLFYDRYAGDFAGNVARVRAGWPWLECDIAPVAADLAGFDVVVASSWPTAHVAASRALAGQPLIYFVQDYEPYFYPRGSQFALAEDSYRLGLRTVALGAMVQSCLRNELGITAETVPFGVDRSVYRPVEGPGRRRGVVFYARRGNDRRGYLLAVLALRHFHEAFPDEPIHVYGDAPADLDFPVVAHGSISPGELNELYSRVVCGLALSFTNISLVAEEMLRAGVLPIVNDSPLARADLAHPAVVWAPATPWGLAEALGRAVRTPPADPQQVSDAVLTPDWSGTAARFAAIVGDAVTQARAAGPDGA